MSVLLLDVVDSTPISEKLGPESFGLLIRELRRIARATIEAHSGYVAQYLGDGVLAFFGYPSAYFDHARYSIEAGLNILRELRGWPAGGWRELSEPIQVRIACHSGSLIAEPPKSGSVAPPAEGVAINICTRLQAEAPPGTLIVSADCLDLAQGFFETEHLGARNLKGVARKISIYLIKGRRSSNTRFQASHGSDLMPMVGRVSELSFLEHERQRSAKSGRAVVVVGEPGIGKSRLVEEFRLGLETRGAAYIIAQCEEPISNTPFGPFINLMSRDLQINAPRSGTDRHQVLGYLKRLGLDEGFCATVELLLGIQSNRGPIPTPVESHEQIRRLLRSFILARPDSGISLILEDVHWGDQSTLKFISELILEGPQGGLFVLITARPEGLAQQFDARNVNILSLRPLDPEEARHALTNLDPRLVPDIIDEIVSRSDGIPLYLEELYRARAREGQSRNEGVADIPERLQGVIWQRLDQLRAHKWVAQLASVGGQSFGIKALTRVVRKVADVRNATKVVRDAVSALQRADLATLDDEELRFRHSLIRDAAYESLPVKTRKSWHGAIADVVERHMRGEPFATTLEVIGRHRSAAGEAPAAARCFARAGAQAVARFANYEAISLFTTAIEECAKIPDPGMARDIEIKIRVMLNAPIIADSGWAAADLETNGKLLLAKCVESNALKEAFSAHRMLFNVAVLRTDVTAVDRHVKGLQDLLARRPTAAAGTIVDRCVGIQAMFLDGDLGQAETRFARSLSTFDREKYGVGKSVSDLDGEVVVKSLRSWLKYFTGDLVRAVDQANSAIELAQRIEHPFSLAYALCLGGSALLSAGEVTAAADAGAKARSLAVTNRMSYWMAYADVLIGGALVLTNIEAGLQVLADARKAYLSTGANLILPWILSLEAEGWRKTGDFGKARALLRQGENHKARLFHPLVFERLSALTVASA
jgi:class 3 adenylate cyclase